MHNMVSFCYHIVLCTTVCFYSVTRYTIYCNCRRQVLQMLNVLLEYILNCISVLNWLTVIKYITSVAIYVHKRYMPAICGAD